MNVKILGFCQIISIVSKDANQKTGSTIQTEHFPSLIALKQVV